MKCALFSLMSFPAVLFQISRDSKLSVYIPVWISVVIKKKPCNLRQNINLLILFFGRGVDWFTPGHILDLLLLLYLGILLGWFRLG